jgi:hypothetical protein
MPEITLSDEFGRAIATTVWAYRCSRIIEVGSWDGTGSTSVLIAAMKGLDNPRLTCVEPNPERHAKLQRVAAPIPWVTTICKPSISAGGYTPRTFRDVWESPYNRLRYPREQVEGWWNETIANATSHKGYLETLTDERWDAALIDGCEFAGYDDYRLLRERVRVLMLEDVFSAYKCAQADDELSRDSRWSCVWRSAFVRSGASIWVKQ